MTQPMTCNDLPIEELVAHVDGELRGDDEVRVARHVAACSECAREADLLRRSGALIARIARLPGHEPSPELAGRVMAAVRKPAPRGRLRLWPAASAAAAVLVAALAARVWLTSPGEADGQLAAGEAREIAEDLYLLANLEALEGTEADELIALVENLDLLEGTEPEVTGLFGEFPGEPGDDSEDGG